MAITTGSERLSRRTKLLYGVGDTGFSLTSTLIGAYFLLFLTDVVGLRPALAGLAIMIGKQWDWINDPIVGHIWVSVIPTSRHHVALDADSVRWDSICQRTRRLE